MRNTYADTNVQTAEFELSLSSCLTLFITRATKFEHDLNISLVTFLYTVVFILERYEPV